MDKLFRTGESSGKDLGFIDFFFRVLTLKEENLKRISLAASGVRRQRHIWLQS
jgi:hypothetical protein